MKEYITIFFIGIFIQLTQTSFWNDIPQRCIYDRTTLFSCWNTTFIQPIPLFNDLSYTLLNHRVEIRDTFFQLSLIDLFTYVGSNIEYLTLINNTFSSNSFNQTTKIYFRLLQTLQIQDPQALQWCQLNSSFFPQLIKLDLSENHFTNEHHLLFNQQNFPVLKFLDLSHNQLQTIENFSGTQLNRLEMLILSFNPLQTISNDITRLPSLMILDLSSTPIKQLFSVTLLPRLETFLCRQCQQIPIEEYERFLTNCSHNLILNLSETNIYSLTSFNPFIKCLKDLTIDHQIINESISINDFLFGINLENIRLQSIEKLNSIHLNIYDRLKSIDFSDNQDLQQVHLRLRSDYTYLQNLRISHTIIENFSVNFNSTARQFLHIDMIDMSDNRLESLDFLRYMTFFSLDLSFNRLKILDINDIHFRHGTYELSLMNFLNLSSNQLESVNIHWNEQSPHVIDLSKNNLQSIDLHGQTTYTLLLNNNSKLSLTPKTFSLNIPSLIYLDLNSIQFDRLENLIYLHNLSNIRTLILNHNQLRQQYRMLNWNIFYPWHKNLTHLSLRNMSLERIDYGIYLKDYYHLLTIDLFDNPLECNCAFQPFVNWLKVPPPPLADFYEPINKVLSLDCPVALFQMSCDDKKSIKSKLFIGLIIVGMSLLVLLVMMKMLHWYIKRRPSKPYNRMENDIIALNETNLIEKSDDGD